MKFADGLKTRLAVYQRAMEQTKIERYALLLAKIQITDNIPDDMTPREFSEIALWDEIGRRSNEIEAQIRKQMGVTAVIDSSVALKPQEEE